MQWKMTIGIQPKKIIELGCCDVNARTLDFGHSMLQAAAEHGVSNVCQLLLDHQADVNAVDGSRTTPLMSCIIGGEHGEIISMLLHAKADASIEAYDGSTAAKWAERLRRKQAIGVLKKAGVIQGASRRSLSDGGSCQQDVKVVLGFAERPAKLIGAVEDNDWDQAHELLCAGGCDVNARALDFGHSLLQDAAHHGVVSVCQLLVAQQADVNAVDGSNTTPLMSCVIGGDYAEIISMLLDAKADTSIVAYNGFKVFMIAKNMHRTRAIKLLETITSEEQKPSALANQATTESVGTEPKASENATKLIEAVENEDWDEAATTLRSGGCDVNARTRDFGYSLLQAAARNGALEVCQLLIAERADVNAVDGNRTTPLMSCAIGGDHPKVALMLLDANADASIEDYDGSTALKWAKRLDRHEVVGMLKKRGSVHRQSARLSSVQSAGVKEEKETAVVDNTPQLIQMVENDGWDEAFALLQAGGCNVNARTLDFGHSLLQEAAHHGAVGVCQLLVAQQADVNAVDGSNTTPLISCVIGGDYGEIISMLLDAKADASMQGQDGSTAKSWANRLRRKKILMVLT